MTNGAKARVHGAGTRIWARPPCETYFGRRRVTVHRATCCHYHEHLHPHPVDECFCNARFMRGTYTGNAGDGGARAPLVQVLDDDVPLKKMCFAK